MAQVTQITINNQAFSTFRTTMNDSLSAINSMHSGTSRPGSATTGTLWLDTTNAGSNSLTIKFFDGSDDITFATIDTSANTVNFIDSVVTGFDIVTDTTPQIGGDLASNGHDILFADNDKAKFGTGNDLEIFHDGSNSNISDVGTGGLILRTDGTQIAINKGSSENMAKFITDGAVELYHNNAKKFETTSSGATVTGTATVTGGLVVDTDTLKVDSSNNRVFVNGTAGTRELNVNGDNTRLLLYSTNNSTGAGQLQFGDANNEQIGRIMYEHDGNKMTFHTNASERIRILSDGKVGIGTTAPDATLTVMGTTGANFKYDSSSTYLSILPENAGGDVALRFRANAGDAPDLLFKNDGGSEIVRIGNTGNVGIGTTNTTTAKLFVNHAGAVDDNGLRVYSNLGQTVPLVYVLQDGAGSSAPAVYIRNDDADGIALHLEKGDSNVTPEAFANQLFIEDDANSGLTIGSPTSGVGSIVFGDSGDADIGKLQYYHNDNSMRFNVNAAERMRIDSSGTVLVATTDTSLYNNTSGSGWFIDNLGSQQTASDNRACADWNRLGNDGTILGIWQAGNQEGSISVSGSTVSYNGFTGTHWSRFIDNSTPTILRGTVLETLDEMCDWYNLEFDVTDEEGNINTKKIPHVLLDSQSNGDTITYNHEGTDVQATIVKETDIKHMKSKVSDTTDAKNVYGLFVAYDNDGDGYNDFYVASVGSYVVRIKQGETIAKGDLLQSNGDGTAKVQTDDNVKSSSFAKVLSTTKIETYEDGSFIVPCSLMC